MLDMQLGVQYPRRIRSPPVNLILTYHAFFCTFLLFIGKVKLKNLLFNK